MTTKPPVPTDDPNTPADTPSKTPAAPEAGVAGTTTPAPADPTKQPASTPTADATKASAAGGANKASEADTESIPVVVGESAAAGSKAAGTETVDGSAASAAGDKASTAVDGKAATAAGKGAGAGNGGSKGPWWKAPWRGVKKIKWRRNPWVTVGTVVVVVLVIAAVGYFAGLGPMNRLNTARGIEPPAKLAGLDRITDEEIRGQLQLDQTREALSRINDGKQATVEAYGDISGARMFIVIALRGKVDIDKTIKDSGASPDLVKVVGRSTCVESTENLPTQCYRGSNTLTVIAQSANDGVGVDTVGPVADEAFAAMK